MFCAFVTLLACLLACFFSMFEFMLTLFSCAGSAPSYKQSIKTGWIVYVFKNGEYFIL
jgi:hypothetical protein